MLIEGGLGAYKGVGAERLVHCSTVWGKRQKAFINEPPEDEDSMNERNDSGDYVDPHIKR